MRSLFSSPEKRITSLFLLFYIFLFIYSPRLVSFNTSHILFIIGLLYLIFNYKKCVDVYVKTKLIVFINVLLFIKLFSVLMAGAYGLEKDFYGVYQLCIELPVCVVFVISLMKQSEYKSEDLVTLIIIVGIIQSIIGVLMLISPSFKEIIDTHRHQFWNDKLIGLSTWRMYGLSDNLLHVTPIVQAVIAMLIIIRASEKLVYLCVFPLFIIFCAINTRTSVVLMFLIVVLHFLFNHEASKKIVVLGFILLFVLIGGVSVLIFIETKSAEGFEYLVTGYNAVMNTIIGESDNSTKFSNGYNSIPSDILVFIFGAGQGVQGGLKFGGDIISGDMGYVNDIWRYGIFLSLLLWWVIFKRIKLIKKSSLYCAKFVAISMLVAFMISHFKGNTTYYCDYMVLLLLISSSYYLDIKEPKWRKKDALKSQK